jgi:hypothetical protein
MRILTKSNYRVEGDLSKLLLDIPEAFYWMGFIAADGSFSKADRLSIGISQKDESHLYKFGEFIDCKNFSKRNKLNSIDLKIQDKFIVPKIMEKFDLKLRKTYNPPEFEKLPIESLFPFFIGFVDGDGSICYQSGRTDAFLRIKVHSSWNVFLQKITDYIYKLTNTFPTKPKITVEGYSNINISNSITLKFIKSKVLELNLPIMNRKWDKIDLNKTGKTERAAINGKIIDALIKDGKSIKEIATLMNMKYHTAYGYINRSKNKYEN